MESSAQNVAARPGAASARAPRAAPKPMLVKCIIVVPMRSQQLVSAKRAPLSPLRSLGASHTSSSRK